MPELRLKDEEINILVAPLDWGLGHASRIVPIIKQILTQNKKPTVCAAGCCIDFLKGELPELNIIEIPSYNIKYSKHKIWLPFKILIQIPKILNVIKKENKWLQQYCAQNKVDVIISDNRYGFYHPNIKSIFLSHQLQIQTPFNWLTHWLQKIHYKKIEKFNELWIVDDEALNLAGKMSKPDKMPQLPYRYLGILSRFKNEKTSIEHKFDYCFLISGPEPQRTILEEKAKSFALQFKNKKICIIRGLPNSTTKIENLQNVEFYNHLKTDELKNKILQSKIIVCRSGYSTIMDLYTLQKFDVYFIPTAGQTEQIYLKNWCTQFKCSSTELNEFFK